MTRSEFASRFTGNPLYGWQTDACDSLHRVGARVCLRCNNEAGKTKMVLAPNAAYDLIAFPKATVLVTSAVYRQLLDQVLPSIKAFGHSADLGWTILRDTITTPTGGLLRAIASEDGGKYEGYHAKDPVNGPLNIYLDEAKSIHEEIFAAVERCNPTRLYIGSSPGAPVGGFYRSANSTAFKQIVVKALDCPHIPPERIRKAAEELGVTSMLYKSMIDAEWMADPNELFVVSRFAVDRCLESPPDHLRGRLIAAVDLARSESGDENVLALRNGNQLLIDMAFVGDGDTVRIVDRLTGRFNQLKLVPSDVWIDGDTFGGAYIDIFRRKGWSVNIFRNGSKARDDKRFANAISEAWLKLGRDIEDSRVILPPDPHAIEQLTNRRYRIQEGTHRHILESKRDMDKSPDRADALAMVWYISALAQSTGLQPPQAPDNLNRLQATTFKEKLFWDGEHDDIRIVPGFNVGI